MLQQRVLSIVTLAKIIERVRLGEEVRWCIGECERGKGKVEIDLKLVLKLLRCCVLYPGSKERVCRSFGPLPHPHPDRCGAPSSAEVRT